MSGSRHYRPAPGGEASLRGVGEILDAQLDGGERMTCEACETWERLIVVVGDQAAALVGENDRLRAERDALRADLNRIRGLLNVDERSSTILALIREIVNGESA